MQGNGLKISLTVFFLVMTGYYLYPSIENLYVNQKLNGMTEEAQADYRRTNFSDINATREKSLKLGLDLQGGMHVTLEVQVEALIRALANDTDAAFEEVLGQAAKDAQRDNISVIDAFVQDFEKRDPNARLSRYFRNDDAGVTRRSSNAEVAKYLGGQADDAVNRAIEIIRDRVDRYGVTEPSIFKQGTRRIVVEMPGIDEPDRVRSLLKGTARLEFHLMTDPSELQRSLQRIIQYYEVGLDSTQTDSSALTPADSTFDPDALIAEDDNGTGNKLRDVMQPLGQGVIFGSVTEQDTSAVDKLLSNSKVQAMLPAGTELLYTANPEQTTEEGHEIYYLLGVRKDIELDGSVITDARVEFDQFTNQPEVSMTMNSDGARTWSRLTGANVGRQVAIVLDGFVYSYPIVNERIPSGRSSINGLDSRAEATDIVTVLKSGALPAPVQIVEEFTVGPSLGHASIRAGFRSVMIGLLLVALFMIFYYRSGGVIADLALILNLIFILGILAGFKATLTLPGIAGVVLTIGMAVDANVLIFERIREEQAGGKTLKAAISGGYAKAFSAIFDANITTFFVGVILYSFGVGPIQGFAVTLMAGILSSMFTAIVFTRILFDYMVLERRMTVSYG